MSPRVEMPLAPVSVGLTTAVTPGIFATWRSDASMAVAYVGSVSVPFGLWSTTCGRAGLGREPLLQQIGGVLALGAGDREALAVPLGVDRADAEDDREEDPRADRAPGVTGAGSPEAFQEARHDPLLRFVRPVTGAAVV